jgi:hypothetical protein
MMARDSSESNRTLKETQTSPASTIKENFIMATTARDRQIAFTQNIKALLAESPPGPEELVELFRTCRGFVKDFGPIPPAERIRLGISRTNEAFIQATINTTGASPNVENLIGRSAADLRAEVEEAARWTAVEDEARVALEGIAAANLVRRYRIGLTALQTYSAAQQLVRSKEHANLLPNVAEMKRLNRFGRKRPVKAVAAPQPVVAGQGAADKK